MSVDGAVSAPLVSVVLPTHDRPALLDEAVRSVARQTMPHWELVIVDDASARAVDLHRWRDLGERLRLARNDAPVGGAASKARGTRIAQGELVTFLDDDDLFAPDLLARAVSALQAHPQVDVLFLGVRWFGRQADAAKEEQSESMRRVLRVAPPRELESDVALFDDRLFEGLLTAIPMDFQRAMVRRSALVRIGLHRSDCLMWDCDWALRAALAARCALLRSGLYLQRADGQEYHSRPGRERAQLESALEMTLRLRSAPPPDVSPRSLDLLRRAASRHAGSLAYFHALHGPLTSSLAAWWHSQRLKPGVASPRVPLAALAHAARRRLRHEPVRR
jgi:glycosyltransferase involved in cell wall biosynthesis